MKGQIGLEKTPEEYVRRMTAVFKEILRVLKRKGSFWLNIGDTYGGSGSHSSVSTSIQSKYSRHSGYPVGERGTTRLRPKCMLMIPERLAFAAVELGYTLRNKIIWYKPNHMPSSVKDRFTNTWEYLYLFSKSRNYWFDLDSVRVPHSQSSIRRAKYPSSAFGKSPDPKHIRLTTKGTATRTRFRLNPLGKNPGDVFRYEEFKASNPFPQYSKKAQRESRRFKPAGVPRITHPLGRNPGDFWSISNRPFREAHFAVFPEKLVEVPIKAGCPPGGVVLDPFVGSGTTMLVAKRLGRSSIGIEISPEYCKIARRRLGWNLDDAEVRFVYEERG